MGCSIRFLKTSADLLFAMSDHSHSESHAETPAAAPDLFTPREVKQFGQDDAEAGAAIGKMLSLFFLYTVLAMAVSTFGTWWWVTHPTVQ